MKKLINSHKESLVNSSKLDFDKIDRLTYLYEFDRAVQYVTQSRRISLDPAANSCE